MRRSLVLALVALTGTVPAMLAGSALAGGVLPTLLGNSVKGPSKLLVRPAEIIYTGDGSGILGGFDGGKGKGFGHLVWTRWTTGSAFGHGADWIDDCRPDCAGGTFTAHRATVNAFRPRRGRFTRLTISTSDRGKPLISQMKLVKRDRSLFYTFAVR
jgi:hypothetical protein